MAADPPSRGAGTEFVGRAWLADAVRDWAASGSAYLFLTGGPGAGKSAAVEHLWGGGPSAGTAVHRCRAASRSTCDPVRFAESLAEQFSATVPGFAEAVTRVARDLSGRSGELRIEGTATAGTVHPNASLVGVRITLSHVTADEAFEQLVCRPLEVLAPAERPIAVVDALDEALTYRGRRTIAELVLDGTDRLPLRFVITSRHDARVTAAVQSLPDAVVVDLVDDAPDPAADLLAYARHQLRGTQLAEPQREALARGLAAGGAGNYLYVRHLTEELASGIRGTAGPDGAAAALPPGLDGVYRQFLRREIRPAGSADAEERWRTAFRPVLALLVAAREDGFTAGRLADLLDRTEQEVLDVVRILGQYLRGGPRGPWTLYHRSFAEFLLSGDGPYIDAAEGHRRIADHAFAEWAGAWESCDDPYLLRHLPDHLMTAIESMTGGPARTRTLQDRLHDLATSPGYLAAQSAAAPDREPHLVTLGLALEASLAAHAYPRAAGLSLGLVRARGEADGVTPVQAALRWGAAAGAAKARTYPEDTALLWLLLIVAALGARSPGEAATVLHEIGCGGFGQTDDRWSPAVAALLAPLVPRFTEEEFAPVLDVAGDVLLGHLAAFLLEEAGPQGAVGPALRIREDIPRARTVTGILTHAALAALTEPTGTARAELDRLGTRIAARHFPGQDEQDEQGARAAWSSLLATPEVADSFLLVHAARGELDARLPELADWSRGMGELTDDAVLLARIVQAARLGAAGVAQACAAGERARADNPADVRILLHHTALMVRVADPAAPALLDALVEASRTEVDDDLYAGHVDAFHGRCGVGLLLAVVRVLAAAGQTDRAEIEAHRLVEHHPAEHVRALAWAARAESRPDRREALAAAAREAADRIPYDLRAQSALVLAAADPARAAGGRPGAGGAGLGRTRTRRPRARSVPGRRGRRLVRGAAPEPAPAAGCRPPRAELAAGPAARRGGDGGEHPDDAVRLIPPAEPGGRAALAGGARRVRRTGAAAGGGGREPGRPGARLLRVRAGAGDARPAGRRRPTGVRRDLHGLAHRRPAGSEATDRAAGLRLGRPEQGRGGGGLERAPRRQARVVRGGRGGHGRVAGGPQQDDVAQRLPGFLLRPIPARGRDARRTRRRPAAQGPDVRRTGRSPARGR
ncbi:hypothetical protein ABT237_16975 [Streptomyces sp. NPDC001581]|uniref:hypothetical protein n=1 Tax=Streptomyces sp. NPDC001581 TaxID=3154386 RepID=UPI003318135E